MRARLGSATVALLLLAACASDDGGAAKTLVRTAAEPAGANCAHGGTVVSAGADADRDEVLDDSEVAEVGYVCDEPGAPSTVGRLRPEPAGDHCASGGTAVESGPDVDGDGSLDDNEVATTSYVCAAGEVFEGPVHIDARTPPLTLAQLRQARVIVGDVVVATAETISLPNLTHVIGTITLDHAVAGIALPALARIEGDLDLGGASLVGELELPALRHVGGHLIVTARDELVRLAIPHLAVVGRSLWIDHLSASCVVDLAELREVGGSLLLRRGLVSDVTLTSLTTVGYDARLEYVEDTALTQSLPALTTIGDRLVVGGEELTTVTLPALETVPGLIDVRAPKLQRIALPALTTAGTFTMFEPRNLEELSLPRLAHVSGTLHVVNAPKLATIALDRLTEVAGPPPDDHDVSILFANTGLTELVLPALTRIAATIVVTESPKLSAVRFPALVSAGGINLWGNPAVTALVAPNLASTASLSVEDAPLTEMTFTALRETDYLNVRHTRLVDFRGLPELRRVTTLEVTHNPALTSLRGLGSLTAVRQLVIEDEAAMASLDGLQGLTSIPVYLRLAYNHRLTDLTGLDNVAIVGTLSFERNALATLDGLRELRQVTDGLGINEPDTLTSITGLARLNRVEGDLRITGSAALPAEQLAELLARLGR